MDQRVRDLALRIERGRITTDRLLANQTSQILDHFDQRLDDQEGERKIDQARERFKATLFFPDIEAREDEIVEAFEGTCQWIFEPPTSAGSNKKQWHNFRQWLETGQNVYWINGKPGAGKSTLMKYIVDEPRTARYLSKWEPNTDLIIATFFFKNLGSELQKSTTGLLRSLIWQLIRDWPEMIHLVLKRYKEATGQIQESPVLTMLPTWTDKRLLQILNDFTDEKPTTVTLCVFIDGLDEYVGDQVDLLHIISLLSSVGGCKVCVSSRPDPTFCMDFQEYPQCRVQDLNQRDIEEMVNAKLKPCLEKDKPNETEAIKYLLRILIDRAEGVFLWLSIMIKDLIKASKCGDSINELRERLQTTPNTMYGLYRRILRSLDETYLDYALKTFQIMVGSEMFNRLICRNFETLSLLDFACIDEASWTHVKQFDRPYFCSSIFRSRCRELYIRLNARCGSLIDIKDNEDQAQSLVALYRGQTVDFVHRTAVEYLKDEYVEKFYEKSCLKAAWIPLARAKIGFVFLFSFTTHLIDFDKKYTGSLVLDEGNQPDSPGDFHIKSASGFKELFWDIRVLFLYGENSGCVVDSEKPPGNLPSQLSAQVLETLQYLHTRDDVLYGALDKKTVQLVRKLLSECTELDVSCARIPWEDYMKFAAFWGCESYIRSYLPAQTPDEQLEDILRSTIEGIHPTNLFPIIAFPLSYFNIVKIIVHQRRTLRNKNNDRKAHGKTGNWSVVLHHCRASPCGAFLFQTCMRVGRVLWYYGNSALFGERGIWIQHWLELVEDFVSEEANSNARIGLLFEVSSPDEHDTCTLFFDTTPLGCVHSVMPLRSRHIFDIWSILESKSAEILFRYRFFLSKGTYYRIKPIQSKSLERLLFSRRYPGDSDRVAWSGCFQFDERDEPLTVLQEIVSANDTLDEGTMDKEWARGGISWLEEED